MKLIQWIKKIVLSDAKDEDTNRKEFILNILLVGSMALIAVCDLMLVIDRIVLKPEHPGLHPLIPFFILVFFGILLVFSKMHFFTFAAHSFIGSFCALVLYMAWRWGIELPASVLLCSLLIIMAGIIISSRFSFRMAFSMLAILSAINYLQNKGIIVHDTSWQQKQTFGFAELVAISIIYMIIATVCWLSNREIEKALLRARLSESELQKEKDLLEIRVEERTQELKQAQIARMTEVAKMAEFGKLSSGLFHDLVNPLTALSLNIEKIKNKNHTKEKLADIEKDLDKAKEVTDKMQDFIKAVRKQMSHQDHRKLFALSKEIKDAITMLNYKIVRLNIRVILHSDEEIHYHGNDIKFNQVVTNLLSNAIDSLQDKADGERIIEIVVKKVSQKIIISVSDNGPGIEKGIQSKIFESLFTTKNFSTGTGIGLSIVKDIVEGDFKGAISFTSKPEESTVFTVALPSEN